jgi:hypothetical protein
MRKVGAFPACGINYDDHQPPIHSSAHMKKAKKVRKTMVRNSTVFSRDSRILLQASGRSGNERTRTEKASTKLTLFSFSKRENTDILRYEEINERKNSAVKKSKKKSFSDM